jgi:hypothetical protein
MTLRAAQPHTADGSPGLDPLIQDFVAWVAREPRAYATALEAWRTSCPRLTVWEDAFDRDFVRRERIDGLGLCLVATSEGLKFIGSAA